MAGTSAPLQCSYAAAAILCSSFFFLLLISPAAARRIPSPAIAGPLTPDFYRTTCPSAESIVRGIVGTAAGNEPRMAGSLLRLHFHDCFVQGCDGSLLLETIPGVLEGEREVLQNLNSVRGFNVVDEIKAALEKQCPGVVSCADILAMAARDSVAVSGGPSYRVLLGRRDSLTASRALAAQNLPFANFSVSQLEDNFANVGLSSAEMVVLSGGHTIGKARCVTFARRLTPNPDDPAAPSEPFRQYLVSQCAAPPPNNIVDLDVTTPTLFDRHYYTNLKNKSGVLHTDQILYATPGSTRDLVKHYAANQNAFFTDFVAAMIRMGNITPLTGSQGEIRRNCNFVNSAIATA